MKRLSIPLTLRLQKVVLFLPMVALNCLVILYLIALPLSLGAMEIIAPLLCLTYLGLFFQNRSNPQLKRVAHWSAPVGIEPLIGLYLIAFIGVFLNDLPKANALHAVGKLRWIMIYFFLHNIFKQLNFSQKISKSLLVLSPFITFIALFAFSQFWTGFDPIRGDDFRFPIAFRPSTELIRWRSIGFFNNPLTYGYSFAGFLCLLTGLYFKQGLKIKNKALLLYFSLSFLIIFVSLGTTYARGVWIAVIAGLLTTLLPLKKKIIIPFFVLTLVALAAYLPFDHELQKRFLSIFDPQYASNLERFKLWRANFAMFLDSPLWGVGYEYNDILIGSYFKKLNITGAPESHAHNNYLQFLAGTGIIGLTCFMAFLFKLLKSNWLLLRDKSNTHDIYFFSGTLGLFICILVGDLTECAFKDAEINHLFIFFAAIVSATATQYKKPVSKKL